MQISSEFAFHKIEYVFTSLIIFILQPDRQTRTFIHTLRPVTSLIIFILLHLDSISVFGSYTKCKNDKYQFLKAFLSSQNFSQMPALIV